MLSLIMSLRCYFLNNDRRFQGFMQDNHTPLANYEQAYEENNFFITNKS